MNFPKFVMASDGTHTGLLLDGVFIGQGVQRLDFSTENKEGEPKATIRIMDLDVRSASLERGEEKFSEFLEKLAEEKQTRELVEKFR